MLVSPSVNYAMLSAMISEALY